CYKGAASDALKKCASLLGIALDLYDSDSEIHGESAGGQGSCAFEPRPQTLGDLVTPKKLWMIRNMAREIGADPEKECKAKFNCALEEISKRAASMLIDQLKRYADEQQQQPHEPSGEVDAITVNNEPPQEREEDSQSLPKLKGAAGQITALAN